MSRTLKRLRVHGLIKKVGGTYKYYLTKLGKQVIATGLYLKEMLVVPQLAMDVLKNKVRFVMVGTHHKPKLLHREMEIFFSGHQWLPRYIYYGNTEYSTEWGKICFDDGFQLWENPHFIFADV